MTGDHDDPAGENDEATAEAGELVVASAEARTEAKDDNPSQAAPAGADQQAGPRALRRPALLIAAAALLLTVVIIGVMMARRQIDSEPPVASEAIENADALNQPEAATIEMPTLQGGEPVQSAPAAADKIFNSTIETLKEGAAAISLGAESSPGAINELPPPPTGDFGNGALQDAAKDAAKSFLREPTDDNSIDLSAPDRESALDSLERVAQSGGGDFAAPALPGGSGSVEAAGLNRALELQIADLNNSLGAARQHTEQQAGEIARLNAELQELKSRDAPAARRGRAAVALVMLAEKLRRGEPYRTDLEAYAELSSDTALVEAIEAHADKGVATVAELAARFSDPQNAALEAARRAKAAGPMGRLAANFASLINLRPAGPKTGADAVAILSRAEAALAGGDLNAALSELSSLDPAIAAPLGSWMSGARARVAAEAAIDAAFAAGGGTLSGEPVY